VAYAADVVSIVFTCKSRPLQQWSWRRARRARIQITLLLLERDLFGKPVSTFPDHALVVEA